MSKVHDRANIEARDSKGRTALHIAAQNNQAEGLAKLVELGANIEARDSKGRTALHIAAQNNNVEELTKLVELGANIEVRDSEGKTALHIAALNNNVEALARLVVLGADVEAHDSGGKTAVALAQSTYFQPEVAKILYESGTTISNCNNDTAWHLAAKFNSPILMDRASKENIALNFLNNEGYSALDLAIHHNSPEAFRRLIEQGATDIIQYNFLGNTILDPNSALALAINSPEEFKTLHRNKYLDLNKRDFLGETTLDPNSPLASAVSGSKKYLDLAISLITRTDLLHDDLKGNTIWHYAVKLGAEDIMDKLPREIINMKNEEGLTPLDLARNAQNYKALNKLIELGAIETINTKKLGMGQTEVELSDSAAIRDLLSDLLKKEICGRPYEKNGNWEKVKELVAIIPIENRATIISLVCGDDNINEAIKQNLLGLISDDERDKVRINLALNNRPANVFEALATSAKDIGRKLIYGHAIETSVPHKRPEAFSNNSQNRSRVSLRN